VKVIYSTNDVAN